MTESAIKSLSVKDLSPAKVAVKDFYRQANENNWSDFYVYPNEEEQFDGERCVAYEPKEDCPPDSLIGYINEPVLKYINWCSDLSGAKRDFLVSLGFELKTQCFWCRRPDGSATGANACHIKYNGRYLTADELWLTDIKQRAIVLGYDIRDCVGEPKCFIGWGFWGATYSDAYNALDGFCTETGVTMASASLIRNFQGGHLYVINSFYAYGLHNISK